MGRITMPIMARRTMGAPKPLVMFCS